MPPRLLIAGLGNPGPRYEQTRHNFGFMAADALCQAANAREISMGKHSRLFLLTLPGLAEEILVVKPQTYMNLSGRAVAPVLRYYKLTPAELLVVHDELDLPLGRMRMKAGGGLAGHNGLKSIAQELGTRDFDRLRLGIGRPGDSMDVADFVLHNFSAAECGVAAKVVSAAAAAIRLYCNQGLETAMREAGQFSAVPPPADQG